MRSWICAVFVLLPVMVQAADLTDDFTRLADRWQPHVLGKGSVAVVDGALRLDLSAPMAGKLACADLKTAFPLPVCIEWDQNLVHDTANTYWSGIAIWCRGDRQPRLTAGLGGGGVKDRWGLAGAMGGTIRAGAWYRLRLDLTAAGQMLTVTDRATGKAVGEAVTTHVVMPPGDYFLSFYQNLDRFHGDDGDPYAQDRGVSLVDNLKISSSGVRQVASPDVMRKPAVVFNRAMRWIGTADGLSRGVIAYDACGDLDLTGGGAASTWLADAPATVADSGHHTMTLRLPAGVAKTRAVLRCFQFLLDQHPDLVVTSSEQNANAVLRITITDPYRQYERELTRVTLTGRTEPQLVDLRRLYRAAGYDQRYAELDFVLDGSVAIAGQPGTVTLSMHLRSRPCVVPRSPVVVDEQTARTAGAVIEAVCVNADGKLFHSDRARLAAVIGERRVAMTERGRTGIFACTLRALPVGVHVGRVVMTFADATDNELSAPLRVIVNDGEFLTHFDSASHSYCQSDGKAVGPLLGDLFAWTPFVGIGTPEERIIHGLDEYQQYCVTTHRTLELCKYRPLTRAQIADYMDYLAKSGLRAIRLAPNVSVAEEYLDAGGHVAPRGLEQLQTILEEAGKHGIHVLINLFHYPYGSPGTGRNPPVQQYLDAGYHGPVDFTSERIRPLLHGYLHELLGALRDDTTVLGYSLTGENDQIYGSSWINSMYKFVRSQDPHHLVTEEQGGALQHIPDRDPHAYAGFEPARSAGLGYRTYYTAGYRSDCYFAVMARLYDFAAPAFLAEVASGPGWYNGAGPTWSASDFITKVRDNFWMALLFRQPMAFSWSACLSEDERLIPTTIATSIDWNRFRRRRPQVAVRVYRPDDAQLKRLMEYEAALSALAVDYDYLWGDSPADGYAAVFDARKEFVPPAWGQTLPDAVRAAQPLRISPGSSATLLDGDDGTCVAYVRNTVEYRLGPGYGKGVQELHRQRTQPRSLRLELSPRCRAFHYRVWDIDKKKVVREANAAVTVTVDLGMTSHDFAVLLLPAR